jgi:hypothetical protein
MGGPTHTFLNISYQHFENLELIQILLENSEIPGLVL